MNSRLPISRNTTGTTVARRFSARCRFSNWPPQVRYAPGGSATSATAACAWPTNPPRSRPRTLACTTTRRLPLLRLIWFGPSLTLMRATEDSGITTPAGVAIGSEAS